MEEAYQAEPENSRDDGKSDSDSFLKSSKGPVISMKILNICYDFIYPNFALIKSVNA